MGILIDGVWRAQGLEAMSADGRFVRRDSQFRNWVTPTGAAGPTGVAGFPAEPNRYHLYVSLACPWAHRALIFRKLKALETLVSVSIVHWYMGDDGWTFEEGAGVIPDTVNGAARLYDLYVKAQPDYSGRVTVPVLWDKTRAMIVNNESAEIIRMFNSAFDGVGAAPVDYYPPELRSEIDGLNTRIYDTVNNGVYKCGFATSQAAYEAAFEPLFQSLDWLDQRLSNRRYLCGDWITEADWRLFTTLIRFDAVYVGHFKCNRRRIADYAHLSGYLRDLYQRPGIAPTVDLGHIKRHYYQSMPSINPTGIVPLGPDLDFDAPHGRARIA